MKRLNTESPNTVDTTGTIPENNGVNIDKLHPARTKKGGKSLTISEISGGHDSKPAAEFSRQAEINDVRYIKSRIYLKSGGLLIPAGYYK